MHCDTLKQDNDSTVRGDGGSRVGEVRAGTTSPMPEHKGFMLQYTYLFISCGYEEFKTSPSAVHGVIQSLLIYIIVIYAV